MTSHFQSHHPPCCFPFRDPFCSHLPHPRGLARPGADGALFLSPHVAQAPRAACLRADEPSAHGSARHLQGFLVALLMCIFRLQCLAADAMAAGPVLAECWCTAIADPRSAARYAAVASYTTQSVVSEKYARRVDQPLFALPGLVVLQQWAPREK